MGGCERILIVSNFFYPEITPRAMRTWELAREFARRGNEVTVVVPNKRIYRDNPVSVPGLTVIYGDSAVLSDKEPLRKKVRRIIPEFLSRWIMYFYNHEYFVKYDKGIEKALVARGGEYDLLISLSYPVAVHRAVMKAFARNPELFARVRLAEFSDPPMRGENGKNYFPAYNIFMRRAARFYDHFIVPVENAIPVYTRFKPLQQIAVIPQGFDNSGIRLQEYVPNQIPTFAFAGRFYKNTRDPKPLLQYLATVSQPFRFIIYLLEPDPYFTKMIESFNAVSVGEIVIEKPLARNELILRLSGMDFIVNHNFTYSTATPSKLIDYALAARPVYSFSSDKFDPMSFQKFMDGDYSEALELPDPLNYDIAAIADSFLSQVRSK